MADEYEELQKLRALWSKAIITRDYIFIPLILGIVSVSLTQLPNFPSNLRILFLAIEGLLLFFAVMYWRKISIRTDEDIVGLYGRMLELEKEKGMDIQTKYYYSHLKPEHRKEINKQLGIELNNKNFSKFKQGAESKKEKFHYELLIKKWNELEYNSVDQRGHDIHEKFSYGIIIGYVILTVILLLVFSDSNSVINPIINDTEG